MRVHFVLLLILTSAFAFSPCTGKATVSGYSYEFGQDVTLDTKENINFFLNNTISTINNYIRTITIW